uniref:Very-long-chain 3-oxoacyl-CoA synthase n=1 Tax=Gossypium raimondii TaxID=29730 RepID=A0A0D2UXT6_GOSRA|nr:hypothetical protein B456_011G249100 [Gossypium raimondii]
MEFLMKICLLFLCSFISYFVNMFFQKRNQHCYMLGYECFKAAGDRKLDTDACVRVVMRNKKLGLDQYRFLLKTIVSSGLGEETYGPRNVVDGREEFPSENDAHAEMDEIMFSTLDNLFEKTGVYPSEIDILVINISLFSPAPSLTSRIINRYKMVAIDLVKQLFKTYKNQFAIVVSTESIARHCIIKAVTKAFTENSKLLLPKILPVSELLRYAISTLGKKSTEVSFDLNLKSEVDYFCFHPGGKALIDRLGKSLGLSEYDLEPTRMTLYRFGNTSASGLWYILSYMEAKKRLKKGDKILVEVMKDGLEDTRVWEDCLMSTLEKTWSNIPSLRSIVGPMMSA